MRLRAADLMWYGLLMGCVRNSLGAVVSAFVFSAAALALVVFVLPFLGRKFRPLPVALAGVVIVLLFESSVLMPYIASRNPLRATPLVVR